MTLTLFGNIILLNLFLAIILGNFEGASQVLRMKKFLQDDVNLNIKHSHKNRVAPLNDSELPDEFNID